MCSKAQAGEVLVTDTVRALTRTFLPYQYTGLGTQQLKGIAGGIPLYRVEAGPSARRARLRRQLTARRGRMGRIAVAGLAIVLVLVGVGLYAANRAPDCLTLPSTTRDVVARIDPTRNCVVAKYPVGQRPGAIASSVVGLWVANLDDSTVTAIDPGSGRTVTTSLLGSPVAIAAGSEGSAYVLLRDDQTIGLDDNSQRDRVAWIGSTRTLRETRALPNTGARGTAGYKSVVFSEDLAWISDGYNGRVILVRFLSAGLPPPIEVVGSGRLGPIDAGTGGVWIGDSLEPFVYSVDGPTSPAVAVALADELGGITSMDVTDSAVWLGREAGGLIRLDPGTKARQTFPLGVRVQALAVGRDAVWVVDYDGAVVIRLDPSTSVRFQSPSAAVQQASQLRAMVRSGSRSSSHTPEAVRRSRRCFQRSNGSLPVSPSGRDGVRPARPRLAYDLVLMVSGSAETAERIDLGRWARWRTPFDGRVERGASDS